MAPARSSLVRAPLAAALWLLCLRCAQEVDAVIPTGRVAFQVSALKPQFAGLFCAPSRNSGWGVSLPETQNSRWKHIHLLSDRTPANADGCAYYSLPVSLPMQRMLAASDPHSGHEAVTRKGNLTTLVVADRGNCSFVQKALLAQAAGARGLVIRGTRKAVYEAILASNNGSSTNTTASRSTDATLSVTEKPPFDYDCSRGESFVATLADPVWTTDDAKCSQHSGQCASKMCIPTGKVDVKKGGHQLCCLWDTYILMGANHTQAKSISIPVVYMTIADGKQIERSLRSYPDLLIRTFQREVPLVDVSSVLLWVIGVMTALCASYYSASADRRQWLQRMNPTLTERKPQQLQPQQQESEGDIWELDTKHAIGFIISAGVFLTVFYYVKLGGIIPILFCISATGTMSQLVMAPLLDYMFPSVASRQLTLPVLGDTVALSEVLGLISSASLAVVWYLNRRTCWYLQDVFGISLCFIFLSTVQLPNLKVATLLLSLAFIYDIFFVFISPAIFGSSVMEDVATGGPAAYTRSDYPGLDYCERYPEYPACIDPEPMPMLLVLPRIMDWVGGVSMLGLGDIIIPGMLLSFALRFDYSPKSLGENYYRSVCIGYAVGLGMANIAVTVMQMGQPALMYLVPTTLGSLLTLAWMNGDLRAMWTTGVGLHDSDDKRSDGEADDEEAGYNSVHHRVGASPGLLGSNAAVNDSSVRDNAPLLGSSSP
uniref:PA domain-containing protein n=1 Tax=Globisporangium ultimum (strain ATCC 200006 / CBS 805.95 / DAOM BR144) TaxID=431595 RepID=K3X0Z0_GLOUD